MTTAVRIPIAPVRSFTFNIQINMDVDTSFNDGSNTYTGNWSVAIGGIIQFTGVASWDTHANVRTYSSGGYTGSGGPVWNLSVTFQAQDTLEYLSDGTYQRHRRIWSSNIAYNGNSVTTDNTNLNVFPVNLECLVNAENLTGSADIQITMDGTPMSTLCDFASYTDNSSGSFKAVIGVSSDGKSGNIVWTNYFPPATNLDRDPHQGSFPHHAVAHAIVSTYAGMTVKAAKWPDASPINGLPMNGVMSFNGNPVPVSSSTGNTDSSGLWTLRPSAPFIAWKNFSSVVNTVTVGINVLDTALASAGYGNGWIAPLNDGTSSGRAKLWASPTFDLGNVLQMTRLASKTIEDGSGYTNWSGLATFNTTGLSSVNPAQTPYSSNWVISANSGGGVLATYPGTLSTGGKILGVYLTVPNMGLQRAFRNYRYLRIRVSVAAGTLTPSANLAARIVLESGLPTGSTGPFGSSREFSQWQVSLVPGENVLELDMSVGPGDPGRAGTGGSAGMADGSETGDWNSGRFVWDAMGLWRVPNYLQAPSSLPSDYWRTREVQYVRIEKLERGVNYVIEEITTHDRTDAGRSPLRVVTGSNGQLIQINGRPVAALPGSTYEGSGSASVVLNANDWMNAFTAYCDGGGSGSVWSFAPLNSALVPLVPPPSLRPSSVSETSITWKAVPQAQPYQFIFEQGFDQTCSLNIPANIDLGTYVAGLLFSKASVLVGGIPLDGSPRTSGSGHRAETKITYPPAGQVGSPSSPTTDGSAAADADSYWELFDIQPLPHSSTTGNPSPRIIDSVDDSMVATRSFTLKGNTTWNLFVALSALLANTRKEADIAQCHSTGRILHIWSDAATQQLTADAREGWQNFTAVARVAAPINDSVSGMPRTGLYPSLVVDSQSGTQTVCYQRISDSKIVMATSQDQLYTLGAESVALFTETGGAPTHIRDFATGITLVIASFPNGSNEDLRAVRINAQGTLLTWADGTTEKVIATATTASGRPSVTRNTYDGQQTLLMLHGDNGWHSSDGGETWTMDF